MSTSQTPAFHFVAFNTHKFCYKQPKLYEQGERKPRPIVRVFMTDNHNDFQFDLAFSTLQVQTGHIVCVRLRATKYNYVILLSNDFWSL